MSHKMTNIADKSVNGDTSLILGKLLRKEKKRFQHHYNSCKAEMQNMPEASENARFNMVKHALI